MRFPLQVMYNTPGNATTYTVTICAGWLIYYHVLDMNIACQDMILLNSTNNYIQPGYGGLRVYLPRNVSLYRCFTMWTG